MGSAVYYIREIISELEDMLVEIFQAKIQRLKK